jgi:hypothetical protein
MKYTLIQKPSSPAKVMLSGKFMYDYSQRMGNTVVVISGPLKLGKPQVSVNCGEYTFYSVTPVGIDNTNGSFVCRYDYYTHNKI